MLRKVYSYPGIAEGEVQLRAGKALVRVPFTNGRLDKKNHRNATYVTGDPVVQSIIEGSSMFGHRIFLEQTYGIDDAPTVSKSEHSVDGVLKTASVTDEEKVYPEVNSFEGAVAVLKANGVKAVSLRTVASAAKAANALGIVFPNYSFEE